MECASRNRSAPDSDTGWGHDLNHKRCELCFYPPHGSYAIDHANCNHTRLGYAQQEKQNRMVPIVIKALLWLLAGAINGLKDRSSINGFSSPWWNKAGGWKNKWLIVDNRQVLIEKQKWYYLWKLGPLTEEKFPFSSTALVFLTDGWHLLPGNGKGVRRPRKIS